MDQQELNRVVELVTRQVLAAMGQTEAEPCGRADGLEKLLVVGTVKTEIPGELLDRAAVFDLEDYRKNQNILRYDRVLIAHLSIAQLADIAQSRPGDEAPPLPAPAVSAKPNAARLVTEADAAALVKEGGPVRLPAGAIVTPAARDVFVQARVDMLRES